MNISFLLVVASASALPLLAFLALILRRKSIERKLKLPLILLGVLLLSFAVISTFNEHKEVLSLYDIATSILVGSLTLFILAKFSHGHTHALKDDGAKGIVISEAFHSILDGAVIGTTYLINPIIGYAATVGIITHELPKMLGTISLFRSIGLSLRKTILYGALAQGGSPASAILIYLLGKRFDHERFYSLEVASVSSLAAIVLWIIYLEVRFHEKHPHASHTEVESHEERIAVQKHA